MPSWKSVAVTAAPFVDFSEGAVYLRLDAEPRTITIEEEDRLVADVSRPSGQKNVLGLGFGLLRELTPHEPEVGDCFRVEKRGSGKKTRWTVSGISPEEWATLSGEKKDGVPF